MCKKKIIVLAGGFSEEKEVSLITASEITTALKTRGHDVTQLDPADYDSWQKLISSIRKYQPDIVFNGLHGAEGENGLVQALFSLAEIPLTGSGCRASAITMDKYLSAKLAESIGLKSPAKIILTKEDKPEPDMILTALGSPVVIKPNDSGSSVGISIVDRVETVIPAVEIAFRYSTKVICEEFIDGQELTVTILGDEALPVVEIKPRNGWYDYKNKYTHGNTEYIVPAAISDTHSRQIQNQALNVFRLCGCRVYGRVDFRFDGIDFYFLEINTLPGMTPLSLTPMAARARGIVFPELLELIIKYSQKT